MASSQMHENTRSHFENFQLGHFAIGEYHPIEVVCIGARFYGILVAIHFAWKVPNIELTIYEKERGISGTWFVNRYPLRVIFPSIFSLQFNTSLSSLALKSDIFIRASIQYQYSFETNNYQTDALLRVVDWSGFYAFGPEILAYLNRVVEKYKLMRHIKLRHELTQASWDEATGKWHLRIRRDGDGDAEIEDMTAQWDVTEDGGWEEGVKDWGDKAAVSLEMCVTGSGSSGIQLVTALRSLIKSIANYTLSKKWIGEPFSLRTMLEPAGRDPGSDDYSEAFWDEKYYKEFRHKIEADLNFAQTTIRGSDLQKLVGELFKREMKRRLAARPELIEKIVSQFAVCCRCLTPGPGYLEAQCTENGIELEDGSAEHIDVLVCATGINVSYRFPFTVLGRDGLALNAHWAAIGGVEAYLSIAVDGFSNLFVGGGPNLAVNSGCVTCYI
ncbi:hypothetical protein B0F90DRAFT_1819053 [Multifurca ochricompacta]|uniref:FAD/NAD(P)-binding domain-containing protein n=1 Tax=Multifurca ochricompacta TaxID=376703 RepID=A0AAD4M1J9_9AGAM|nr:hypothetical protein B0F90DRAFT_1819053 [Multifurca ochricompacta]